MSQRLGMADNGRCTTVYESGRLFNDSIYKKNGIQVNDNLAYRRLLQGSSLDDVLPAATCSLFSYVKDSDIVENTNVISQIVNRD